MACMANITSQKAGFLGSQYLQMLGLRPPEPPTRGAAPWPARGFCRPQTPAAIGYPHIIYKLPALTKENKNPAIIVCLSVYKHCLSCIHIGLQITHLNSHRLIPIRFVVFIQYSNKFHSFASFRILATKTICLFRQWGPIFLTTSKGAVTSLEFKDWLDRGCYRNRKFL